MNTSCVCCRECKFFIKDLIGSTDGIGKCKKYEDYKAKGPSKAALKIVLHKLGNRDGVDIFWGGNLVDRICEKYEKRNW